MSVALIFLFLMLFSIVLFLLSVLKKCSDEVCVSFGKKRTFPFFFFESETLKLCQNFATKQKGVTTLKKDGQVYALSE